MPSLVDLDVETAWAVAVWGGFFGCLALLRRRWAVGLFVASLVGFVLTTCHNFGLSDGADVMGTGGVVFSVVIGAVAVLLLVYARRMARRGGIR